MLHAKFREAFATEINRYKNKKDFRILIQEKGMKKEQEDISIIENGALKSA